MFGVYNVSSNFSEKKHSVVWKSSFYYVTLYIIINNIIFCYCFIFYIIINSKRKFHIGPNSKLLALAISISMFVLLSTAGECFELSSMLEFFFSSTCYLTKSTHSEQKTKCTHISCSVESMLKSTFDLYSVLGGQFHSTTVPVLNRHRYPVATRYQVSVPGFHIMLLRIMFYSFGTNLKLKLWLSFYIESVFHTSGSFCKGPSTFAS